MQSKIKQFTNLLLPSWLSSVVVVSGAAIATGVAVFIASGTNNILKDGVASTNSLTAPAAQHVADVLARSSLISNLPLVLLYAAVGVLIYLLAEHVIAGLRDSVELSQTMGYVNSNRERILVSTIERLIIRVVVVLLWFAYSFFFLKVIFPYFILLTQSFTASGVLKGSILTLLAGVILGVGLHIHVVFLRFFLLRRISSR